MAKENGKALSLTCPSCGGTMELSTNEKPAKCPYCGHLIVLQKEDAGQKEYARLMARAHAEEDIRDLQIRRQRGRRLRGWLTALCVIAVILLINVLIPGSPVRGLFFPQTVDPFTAVDVRFSGMSGEGKAELVISDNCDADYAEEDSFEIRPQTGLSNGDTVTVKARPCPGWRFEPSEKQFTVAGLTAWVQHTAELDGDNLALIHANTERLIREDWEEIVSSEFATDISISPYRMYLFLADDGGTYEYNVLYDTYEVSVTRKDGSVLVTYEACRYTDLKIPADGVLTAGYGSLQGFHLGYSYGFSYTHAFSGWTDAAEMEADLRHARDGYHLAD